LSRNCDRRTQSRINSSIGTAFQAISSKDSHHIFILEALVRDQLLLVTPQGSAKASTSSAFETNEDRAKMVAVLVDTTPDEAIP
jgi:hypothetical protein